jgi:hypothetical protein
LQKGRSLDGHCVGGSIDGVFGKRSLPLFSLSKALIGPANVIVSSIEYGVLAEMKLLADVDDITGKCQSLQFFGGYPFIEVASQTAQEESFRGLAN